jgi:hypothetical protein
VARLDFHTEASLLQSFAGAKFNNIGTYSHHYHPEPSPALGRTETSQVPFRNSTLRLVSRAYAQGACGGCVILSSSQASCMRRNHPPLFNSSLQHTRISLLGDTWKRCDCHHLTLHRFLAKRRSSELSALVRHSTAPAQSWELSQGSPFSLLHLLIRQLTYVRDCSVLAFIHSLLTRRACGAGELQPAPPHRYRKSASSRILGYSCGTRCQSADSLSTLCGVIVLCGVQIAVAPDQRPSWPHNQTRRSLRAPRASPATTRQARGAATVSSSET